MNSSTTGIDIVLKLCRIRMKATELTKMHTDNFGFWEFEAHLSSLSRQRWRCFSIVDMCFVRYMQLIENNVTEGIQHCGTPISLGVWVPRFRKIGSLLTLVKIDHKNTAQKYASIQTVLLIWRYAKTNVEPIRPTNQPSNQPRSSEEWLDLDRDIRSSWGLKTVLRSLKLGDLKFNGSCSSLPYGLRKHPNNYWIFHSVIIYHIMH